MSDKIKLADAIANAWKYAARVMQYSKNQNDQFELTGAFVSVVKIEDKYKFMWFNTKEINDKISIEGVEIIDEYELKSRIYEAKKIHPKGSL